MIKLRILRWRDYPGLSELTQCNHKSPYKTQAGGSESEREDIRMEAESERRKDAMLLAWKMGGGAMSQGNASGL